VFHIGIVIKFLIGCRKCNTIKVQPWFFRRKRLWKY